MVCCPACSRPNGDERRSCLYCGAVLADPSRIARETAAALFPKRERGLGGHLVAILPGQLGDGIARAAAPALGCDPYMAGQILRRQVPPIARFDGELQAAAFEGSLQRGGIDYVSFAESLLDDIPDAVPVHAVRIDGHTLELESEGLKESCPIARLAYLVVGQIEIHKTKHIRDAKVHVDRKGETREIVTSTELPDFDAFTVFDIYGVFPGPARLLESVCTIEGPGFARVSRGGGFARFGPWLKEERSDLVVDDRYRQLGKQHRRGEVSRGGRTIVKGPFHSREVLGTASRLSGQGFDQFSAIAWTIWRLTQERNR